MKIIYLYIHHVFKPKTNCLMIEKHVKELKKEQLIKWQFTFYPFRVLSFRLYRPSEDHNSALPDEEAAYCEAMSFKIWTRPFKSSVPTSRQSFNKSPSTISLCSISTTSLIAPCISNTSQKILQLYPFLFRILHYSP